MKYLKFILSSANQTSNAIMTRTGTYYQCKRVQFSLGTHCAKLNLTHDFISNFHSICFEIKVVQTSLKWPSLMKKPQTHIYTHSWGTYCEVMISKLDKKTIVCEFDSHWVSLELN